MDEKPLLNYNLSDGFRNLPLLDDIVRIVLEEQKHSLTEEDQRILRDRENLQNELHTLQNANPITSKECDLSTSWYKSSNAESSTSSKSDVYFVDVEAIECASLTTLENIETSNFELDNTIVNFIQDENVKAEVFRLNQQIKINSASIRALSSDAKNLMMVKLNLQRKLVNVEKKIASFSSEEIRVNRIKRKKGTNCVDTGHKKRTYFYRFGAPYFKTKERFPSDRNPDLMEIIRTNQLMSIRLPHLKRFLPHDAAFLENSVLKQLKTRRVEQLQKCLKQAEDRLKNDKDNNALAEEIRYIVRTIKETKEISHISATIDWNIPVDFMALPQSARFTGEDYERIWKLTGSPSLSRAEFCEKEYSELKLLAEKYNGQDWDQIASEMSTKRSGFMCFTKYRATEKKGKNKPWTKEENELLHNLCISMDFVSKSDSRYQFWKIIRSYFPHRTYTQVHSHWTYVLEPRLKKGRFTPDENSLMLKLFNEGKSYKEIAQLVHNRTCVQIRTHFEAMMQKQTNRGNWTSEEEEKLLQLIEKYGTHNWVIISKELGTRNRSQCRLKYMLYEKNNQRFSLGTRAPKDLWTREENEQFKEFLRRYGTDFTKMSQEMKTKDRNQLRYKYHRTKVKAEFIDVVSPWEKLRKAKKDKCNWTNEELAWFKQLLMQYGTQYKMISSLMGKTPLQLRYKYHSMKNEWNLPLPSMRKSYRDVSENISKSGQKDYESTTFVSSASSPVPIAKNEV